MDSSSRVRHIALVVAGMMIGGCGASPRFAERGDRSADRTSQSPPARETSSGRVLLSIEGVASYYSDEFHGRLTSNGETYDMNGLTAAHRTFPFGTRIRVNNLDNGRTVVVRVNDRGPFKEGRIIDLSLGAAKAIGLIASGTARVRLDVIEWGTGR